VQDAFPILISLSGRKSVWGRGHSNVLWQVLERICGKYSTTTVTTNTGHRQSNSFVPEMKKVSTCSPASRRSSQIFSMLYSEDKSYIFRGNYRSSMDLQNNYRSSIDFQNNYRSSINPTPFSTRA
jgi:hypothetical protein